jgi:hypothetical protein
MFSDPPYPFKCLLREFASTFERYQLVGREAVTATPEGRKMK